jgi:hypothetical protein
MWLTELMFKQSKNRKKVFDKEKIEILKFEFEGRSEIMSQQAIWLLNLTPLLVHE